MVRGYVYNRTNLHPVFKKPEYEAYLVKIAPIGSVVTVVRAYDPDNLDERNIVYSIYRGDDRTFQIDSKSGVIRTKGELSADIYMLYIAAEYSDQVRDRLQSEQRKNITVVKITVKEVDITKPVFLKSHYQARVREDATINTLVLKVEATDEKMSIQSHLNYSIPNPRGTFFIDSRSGEIRVATKLDYEKTTRYVFVVSVNEVPETSQSSCTDVTIDVVDVNDNTPTIVYAPKSIELKKVSCNAHVNVNPHVGEDGLAMEC